MISFSARMRQLNKHIQRMEVFKGNITTILEYLSDSTIPVSVIDEVVGYLLLDEDGFIEGKKPAYEYHASKYIYGKYAKDTRRRWMRLSMYSKPSDWENSSRWVNIYMLATSFWNKTIKEDGHLIVKTTKDVLARKSTKNFLRPKFHYGEFMPCPNCNGVIKLVYRWNKLFAFPPPEYKYFKCRSCGYEIGPEMF